MAKNCNLSDLDAPTAIKRTIDHHHDAIRVVQAFNTEMAIEVSAEDGDSVQAVARTRVIKESDGEQGCKDLRRICLYSAGTVEVSPDGIIWIQLPIDLLEVKDICASKIRVHGCMVVGQS